MNHPKSYLQQFKSYVLLKPFNSTLNPKTKSSFQISIEDILIEDEMCYLKEDDYCEFGMKSNDFYRIYQWKK
jgi:hypothetical protein